MDKISSWSCRKSSSGNSDNARSYPERTITPAGNLACRFSKGVRSRSRIYRTDHIYYGDTTCTLYVHVMGLPLFFRGQAIQPPSISPQYQSWERSRPMLTKDLCLQTRSQIDLETTALTRSAVRTSTLSHRPVSPECLLEPGILTLTFSVR